MALSFDIKGANILVGPGVAVKLADFGSAIKMTDREYVTGFIGTYWWMAPEVRNLQSYGVSADIWSVGCTTVELLRGKHPYFNMELVKICSITHRPPQITSLYGGPLEFLFIVESTEDPVYHAIRKLISDFQDNVNAKIIVA